MAKYPRLRCPVCGMTCWSRNIKPGKKHKLEAFVIHLEGYKRIWHERKATPGLREFWIGRLQEVLEWLGGAEQTSKPEVISTVLLHGESEVTSNPLLQSKSLLLSDSNG